MSSDRGGSRRYELAGIPLADEATALWALALAVVVVADRYGRAPGTELRTVGGASIALPDPRSLDDRVAGDLRRPDPRVLTAMPAALVTVLPGAAGGEQVQVDLTVQITGQGVTVTAASGAGPVMSWDAMMGHVERVLRACVDTPDRRLAEVDILTDADLRRLHAWNGSVVEYPATTLHQMFAEQAARTPDAVAIIDGARRLSYAELDRAANRVARQLRPHVRQAGQVVAARGPRSADTLIVQVGIMKAGAAYLYLDPTTPAARTRLMCDIAGPVAVVAPRGYSTMNCATAAPQFVVEELVDNHLVAADPLPEIADETTAAHILFTSGSTGEPKGVVRPHRMQTTRVMLEQNLYQLGPTDRHLMKSVPFFRELFWALATGGAVVVARPGGEQDDSYLIDLIRQTGITVCSFVPSMVRVLLANPRFREPGLPIRHLFTAGEVFDVDLERRLRAGGVPVHVTYTLAEADYVCHRGGPDKSDSPRNSVGRPIDMRVYVCDAAGRRCPPGIIGEIYTGGPGLADAYLNRPELTAERFVDNPFEPVDTPRLFRTGDLGRWRSDGQLEFIGRADFQVKIRGHRVEPTEIEHALRTDAAVDDALVAGLSDPDAGAVLVAYVVLRPGQELHAPRLRNAVAMTLPAYMVPTLFVEVPALARLGSGKVDRASLHPPALTRPAGLPRPVPATTDLERAVVAVWSMVLGVSDTGAVGVEDTFADLGGDSLRLMLLRIALEERLGRPVGLAQLVTAPTVRDFVDSLQGGW